MRTLQIFVVLGSSLLFMLQPLVGRLLLPVHGGSFQVWTTCMLFFQLALLAGYAYAHVALARFRRVHRVSLLLSLVCAPLALDHIPARAGSIVDILGSLSVCVALPFILLASTSIVAQARAAKLSEETARDAYTLYAYSNLGSLLGLISYPFALEPWLGLWTQRALWAALYIGYVGMAWRFAPERASTSTSAPAALPHALSRNTYWIALSACACSVLLGQTNVFSLGAGSIPLIWALTLATYLLGFVAGFSPAANRFITPSVFLPEVLGLALLIYADPRWLREAVSESSLLALQLGCLFWSTWSACAELYRTRPDPQHLSRFYLAIAFGGALGGVLISIVAPLTLADLHEYPASLLALGLTVLWARRRDILHWLTARTSWAQGERMHAGRIARTLAYLALTVWIASLLVRVQQPSAALRNFYGLYAIWDYDRGRDSDGITRAIRIMSHNGTNHGFQSRRADERCTPTGYFHRLSPIGELLAPAPSPRRAAVIGLGAGTLAAYFTARDALTFYELDADTVTLAHKYFTYLDGCPARPRIVLGDARLQLARDRALPDHSLDVLIVDAFSGDSIPVHLLTREAQTLYMRKLTPHGQLVFHVSSRFYDLWPTIASTARTLGLYSAHRTRLQGRELGPLAWSSRYLVVSRDAKFIDELGTRGWILSSQSAARIMSDDHASLLFPLWRHFAAR